MKYVLVLNSYSALDGPAPLGCYLFDSYPAMHISSLYLNLNNYFSYLHS